MESGIYEQIINKKLSSELEKLPGDCKYQEKVDAAEASKVLATYVAGLLQHKMDCMYESSGDNALSDQIMYINKVIKRI